MGCKSSKSHENSHAPSTYVTSDEEERTCSNKSKEEGELVKFIQQLSIDHGDEVPVDNLAVYSPQKVPPIDQSLAACKNSTVQQCEKQQLSAQTPPPKSSRSGESHSYEVGPTNIDINLSERKTSMTTQNDDRPEESSTDEACVSITDSKTDRCVEANDTITAGLPSESLDKSCPDSAPTGISVCSDTDRVMSICEHTDETQPSDGSHEIIAQHDAIVEAEGDGEQVGNDSSVEAEETVSVSSNGSHDGNDDNEKTRSFHSIADTANRPVSEESPVTQSDVLAGETVYGAEEPLQDTAIDSIPSGNIQWPETSKSSTEIEVCVKETTTTVLEIDTEQSGNVKGSSTDSAPRQLAGSEKDGCLATASSSIPANRQARHSTGKPAASPSLMRETDAQRRSREEAIRKREELRAKGPMNRAFSSKPIDGKSGFAVSPLPPAPSLRPAKKAVAKDVPARVLGKAQSTRAAGGRKSL